jgi:TetR/AcrR family transcriptional repressor of nem operon
MARMVTRKGATTAERILDVAQDIMQTRGYSAMTLEEVAKGVEIRKPSIIHHFTGKADLGKSVIERYRANVNAVLEAYVGDAQMQRRERTAADALDLYFGIYLGVGEGGDKICLCGSLASEFAALPDTLQREVRRFFEQHQDWLETILALGGKTGEFRLEAKPRALAKLFLDALQGSLVVARATGERNHVRETIRSLKAVIEFAGRRPLRAVHAR